MIRMRVLSRLYGGSFGVRLETAAGEQIISGCVPLSRLHVLMAWVIENNKRHQPQHGSTDGR